MGKGTLLVVTLFFIIVFLSGVDSIFENNTSYQWIGLLTLLISSSYVFINKEDIILMDRYLKKIVKWR